MLGLYLYTLIIGHKSCKMLSILNKLTLQKELTNFVTKGVFLDKKRKINNNKSNKKSNIKSLAGDGHRTGPLAPKADALPLHHRVNGEYPL